MRKLSKKARKELRAWDKKVNPKRINSRQKGAAGERELANLLKTWGFTEARRGQQFSGIEGKDIVGVPGFHIECKRTEVCQPYNWLAQAKRDCGFDIPLVIHRRNDKGWVAIMELDEFLPFIGGKQP